MNLFKRIPCWPLPVLGLLLLTSCGSTTADALPSEQAGLKVSVTGHLVRVGATTGSGAAGAAGATGSASPELAGIQAQIFRVSSTGERVAHTEPVTSDASGMFRVDSVPLLPWQENYELSLNDPAGRYQSRAFTLFVLAGALVDYGDISMYPFFGDAQTFVTGLVRSATTGEALPSTAVQLSAEGSTPLVSTTDSDGRFRFDGVKVQAYQIDFDATNLTSADAPHGYVSELRESALAEAPENDLGQTFLVPLREQNDLSIVFSAPRNSACEATALSHFASTSTEAGFAHLSLPPPNFADNFAYGLSSERWDEHGLTVPAGFGLGTPFWPAFLGERSSSETTASDSARVRFGVGYSRTSQAEDYRVNDKVFVHGTKVLFDDRRVETIVIHQTSPLRSFPSKLAYYYAAGGSNRRYPIGTILFSAATDCFAEAEVSAYLKQSRVSHFVFKAAEARQSGEITEWAPLLVEYGFTTADPSSDSELYFEVIPVAAIDLTSSAEPQAYQRKSGLLRSGWSNPPNSLSNGAAGDTLLCVAGVDASGKAGIWYLDRTHSTIKAVQDATASADPSVIAMTTVAHDKGFDTPFLIYRNQDGYQIRDGRFDDVKAPAANRFDCGEPTVLGLVGEKPVIGTTKGIAATSCFGSLAPKGMTWLDALAKVAPESPVAYVGDHVDDAGQSVVLLGTRGKGAYCANSQPAASSWTSIKASGLDGSASIVAAADYGGAPYLATATTGIYFGLNCAKGTFANLIPVGTGQGGIPNQAVSAEDGKNVGIEIRTLAVFRDRLYIGTNLGIWEYDRSRVASCQAPFTTACIANAIRKLRGFPATSVQKLVVGVGGLYAVTSRGLFEIIVP